MAGDEERRAMKSGAGEAGARASRGAKRGCPVCGKPAAEQHRPFCSRRCADRDLGRWLKGAYAIPTNETPAATPGEAAGEEEEA